MVIYMYIKDGILDIMDIKSLPQENLSTSCLFIPKLFDIKKKVRKDIVCGTSCFLFLFFLFFVFLFFVFAYMEI